MRDIQMLGTTTVMTYIDWIPALSSTGLLAVVVWLCRNLISNRLTRSVEYEFNQKIERLRADLRAKENEIETLRSGALSALASRQIAVDKRRLEAVDQLWTATMALNPARAISNWLSVLNFESAAKAAENDPNVRRLFEMFGSNFDPNSLNAVEAQKARPFVSPMAWATYSALLTVSVHAIMRWQVLKGGLGKDDFANTESINKLLKTVLPRQEAYIDKYGPEGYHYLLEEIEKKLLSELQSMLSGTSADKENVERAAEIVKLSNVLLSQAGSAQQDAARDSKSAARPTNP
ncbi:hypothetical protein [Hahella sp. NBU794]|uniref:hypothetical protein n=1 Tax=Hahella sp. NBU794 TaxID=3422590 RepID=UPI003D6FB018